MSDQQPGFSWLKISIVTLGITVALVAFSANRTVVIPMDNKTLTLFNSSTNIVIYNMECYDSVGAVDLSITGATLAPNLSTSIGSTGSGCNDSNITRSFVNGMTECGASVVYASAAAKCSAGFQVCSIDEYLSNRNGDTVDNAWVSENGFSATWGTSFDSGTSFSDTPSTNKPFAQSFDGAFCNTGPGSNGGVNKSFCGAEDELFALNVLCCPGAGNGVFAEACKVEITSPGHLSSPQFNGAKPF